MSKMYLHLYPRGPEGIVFLFVLALKYVARDISLREQPLDLDSQTKEAQRSSTTSWQKIHQK